jgi:putative flippase GtrA
MRSNRALLAAYVANGLVATAVHFSVLWANLRLFGMHSAGAANGLAAVVGIAVSFVGNRSFVFGAQDEPILGQAMRYVGLYAAIALMHGGVMWLWSDVSKLDFRAGFFIATALQFVLSFAGNRYLVFRDAA